MRKRISSSLSWSASLIEIADMSDGDEGLTDRQRYVLDLALPCPAKKCSAAQWVPCTKLDLGIVHFGRRLQRLLREARR
jgi:hypothetical protein